MDTTITVTILDANDIPVRDTSISLNGLLLGKTDKDGVYTFSLSDHGSPYDFLYISHVHYVSEKVGFRGSISKGEWDNALVSRTVETGRAHLRVYLGRLHAAPTELRSDEEVQAILASRRNLEAALLFKLPRDQNLQAYRGQWNDPLPVELGAEKVLPEHPPTPADKGWQRFRSFPANPAADVMTLGRFFWMLYPGQPKDDQYAVAIWSPKIDHQGPLHLLDFVVFFSPDTGWYRARYPFGLVPPGDQQYMTLGKRYLLDEFGFAYNLTAQGRQAVMVMPICKAGNWGPFSSGEGIFRLCREVALFLHRECRTSNLAHTSLGGVNPQVRLAGGSLRTPGVGIWSVNFGRPPRPGRIVIGGFSAGIAPVKSMMQLWRVQGYNQQYWGCPPWVGLADPQRDFAKAWMELWDLDGSHRETGGWKNYMDRLSQWILPDQMRMVRLFHSRGQPDPKKSDGHSLWKRLFSEGPVYEQYAIPLARELQGKRWTAVHIDAGYVGDDPTGGVPLLWLGTLPPSDRAHQAVPKVAFSHFVALSPVGELPQSP
ncbi:hypothetical protein FALCPG4_015704 [Fusarium falciforme]